MDNHAGEDKMNYKIYVKDEETSKKVQKHAFKLGYYWANEVIYQNPKSVDFPFLYFECKTKHITCSDSCTFMFFKAHEYKELTPEEFLALPISDKEWTCPNCEWYDSGMDDCIKISPCGYCSYIKKDEEKKLKAKETVITDIYCSACRSLLVDGRCNNHGCSKFYFNILKMTEFQAYKIATDMWYFLYTHPDKEKRDWPDFYKYKLSDTSGNCTMCIYHKNDCGQCYLYAQQACSGISRDIAIPYWRWKKNINLESRRDAAGIIFEHLQNRYIYLLNKDKDKNKNKYTHEQIMTGWFRQKYINEKGIDESNRCK